MIKIFAGFLCGAGKISRIGSLFSIHQSARAKMSGDTDVNTIQEGRAHVLTPKSVFYNPVQEFNRDLTIAVISQYAREHFENKQYRGRRSRKASRSIKVGGNSSDPELMEDKTTDSENDLQLGVVHENGIRILEGLAASGLRSVRFGLEIPGIKEIVANDFDEHAVSFIEKNIEKNDLKTLVKSNFGDAAMVMYQNRSLSDQFDVIDLDPYGSPSIFLDAAVQAVTNGGLLCVTCTDMAVMCGNSSETCHSKYGSTSLKAKYCHEMALRIILQSIESHANRYSRYIVPLISISVDFYVRVFVRVYTGQAKVKDSASKLAMVYNCTGCGTFHLQPLGERFASKGGNFKYSPATGPPVGQFCEHCGFKYQLGGPIWADPIHDTVFIEKVLAGIRESEVQLKTTNRIVGMLNMLSEELDTPLYYILDELCNVLHCSPLSMETFRSAILNAGYGVSMSHAAKNSHKTDAPSEFIWDVMKAWIKDHPVKADRLKNGTPAKAILDKPQSSDVCFDVHPDANPRSRKDGLLRWQINPEREWGPKPRAKISGTDVEMMQENRAKNQNKKKTKIQPDRKQFPCKRFKSGDCVHGSECLYKHEETSEGST